MLKQLEGARLGLFVFLGTVLIVLSIFLIGITEIFRDLEQNPIVLEAIDLIVNFYD